MIAYLWFLKNNMYKLKSNFPEFNIIQLSNQNRTEWLNLDDEERERYKKIAKNDKERFRLQKAEWEGKGSTSGENPGEGEESKKIELGELENIEIPEVRDGDGKISNISLTTKIVGP